MRNKIIHKLNKNRRKFLCTLAGLSAANLLWPITGSTRPNAIITRRIPASNKAIPVVGLGSSRTFNVGNDPVARDTCAQVMHHFFGAGGRLIDSSPMYGSSQSVIGYGLDKIEKRAEVFAADKVWTSSAEEGPEQMTTSQRYWGIQHFDLMQVHNLLEWEAHLPILYAMKAAGDIRYVGITTSHGRRHEELEKIMRSEPLDFVQLSYNILDREVEQRLLPLARDRGIAIIVNRPFQRGDLIDQLSNHPLPSWANEIDCRNWAQFLLKFIVSNPAVTCAIPATTRVDHVIENMGAATGRLPDADLRKRMVSYVKQL